MFSAQDGEAKIAFKPEFRVIATVLQAVAGLQMPMADSMPGCRWRKR